VAPGDERVGEVEVEVVVVCVGARKSRKGKVERRPPASVLNRRVALGRIEGERAGVSQLQFQELGGWRIISSPGVGRVRQYM